jgi:uncharacterized protein (DUF2267 family)
MSRTRRQIDAIQRTVQKTEEWLNDLGAELGTEDERYVWRALRAYLQVLRDRLTVDEAAQLAAQLPHLLRGVYYEGFDPSRAPERIRTRDEFLERLADRAQLSDAMEAAGVAALATRVMRRHVSAGEVDNVLSQLPTEIRDLLGHG